MFHAQDLTMELRVVEMLVAKKTKAVAKIISRLFHGRS